MAWRTAYRFTVPGKPVGYYAVGKRPNWTRMNSYHAYKRHIAWCAELQGVPVPLEADRERPLYISTVAYFKDGHHPDPGNVQKGVVDALFYRRDRKGGGDKHTGGAFESPLYDAESPRVEVTIEVCGAEGAR